MKILLVSLFTIFLAVFTPVRSECYAYPTANNQNIVNKTWKEIVKTQKQLTIKISRTLKQIKNNESPNILFFGIGIAFLYGVIHAIGPGHSKTIVASYFLSNKSRFIKPIIMSVQISAMHCVSAIVFVLLADVSLRAIMGNPDGEIRIISLFSYALIFLVGVYLLISKYRGKGEPLCACSKNSTMLALSAGLIPCTGSLVIMLYAMANQMLLTGIVLVAAISAGIAVTISAVGIFSNLANRAIVSGLDKCGGKSSKIITSIEYAGFGLIALLGLVMFWGTFW